MKEVWKPILHYEDAYLVSNYGRVKALERDTYMPNGIRNGHIKEHIVPQNNNGRGYQFVVLNYKGKSKREYVHRLVALTFIPNPENKPQVDHIDTDRANNLVTNLRWVTQSENNKNEITNSKMKAAWTDERRKQAAKQMRKNNKIIHKDYWSKH